MNIVYEAHTGVNILKTNTKKYIYSTLAAFTLLGGATGAAYAMPTPGPVPGPGCFGQWRAGSVQVINQASAPTDNAGARYFSERAGSNATQNVTDKASCAY